MKKIIPILLLSLIAFSQLGYYCVSLIRQHIAKEDMEREILAGIPESSLKIFELETNQDKITWEEKGKEFSFQGNLYDVVKTITNDGKTLLYCISDNREDELLKERSAAVCSLLDQHSNNQLKKVMPFFHLSDCLVIANNLIQTQKFSDKNYRPYFETSLVSTIKPVNTPPPNFFIQ